MAGGSTCALMYCIRSSLRTLSAAFANRAAYDSSVVSQVPNLLRRSVREQLKADVQAATRENDKPNHSADAGADSEQQTAGSSNARGGQLAGELAEAAERTNKSVAHADLTEELKLARMELRRVDEVIFGKHLGQGELGRMSVSVRALLSCSVGICAYVRAPLADWLVLLCRWMTCRRQLHPGYRCTSALRTQSSTVVAAKSGNRSDQNPSGRPTSAHCYSRYIR